MEEREFQRGSGEFAAGADEAAVDVDWNEPVAYGCSIQLSSVAIASSGLGMLMIMITYIRPMITGLILEGTHAVCQTLHTAYMHYIANLGRIAGNSSMTHTLCGYTTLYLIHTDTQR